MNETLIKTFTKDRTKGNPAYVVKVDGSVTQEEIQAATASHDTLTVFMYENESTPRVRFFPSQKESPFCGHGLIAVAHDLPVNTEVTLTLAMLNKEVVVRKNEDGLIHFNAGCLSMDRPYEKLEMVAHLLNIPVSAIDPTHPLTIASIGSPKLLVPVKCLTDLHEMSPHFCKISAWSHDNQVNGIYVYTEETLDKAANFHARSFNPLYGVEEDIATGVAAGALSGVLYKRYEQKSVVIEQGYVLGSGSTINSFVDERSHVYVGGYAVRIGKSFSLM
ncbi:PhzF family phenazine biosynthesis protein [Bacillus sp. FSL W7-1360]